MDWMKAMKFAKGTDGIIIAVILLVSLLVWAGYGQWNAKEGAIAEIYVGSVLVEQIFLDEDAEGTFSVAGKENVVFALDGKGGIRFQHSDCPDQICVRTGLVNRVGEYAACLPNEIILKIVSAGKRNPESPDLIASP